MASSWSTTSNVAWRIDVPGRGWSSPVAWKDQVFVTSAISPGDSRRRPPASSATTTRRSSRQKGLTDEEVLKAVTARDIELTAESGEIRYMVYGSTPPPAACRWEREAHKGLPVGGRHRKNTYASETPATDGERL